MQLQTAHKVWQNQPAQPEEIAASAIGRFYSKPLYRTINALVFTIWKPVLKKYVGLAALLAAAPLYAADLVNHADNRPASLDTGAQKRVQVVNVWATWCVPCRREMPALSQWYAAEKRQRRGVRVDMAGVALDKPADVSRFLQSVPVRYPILRYTGNDSTAWMHSLGNQTGALPFTVIRAPACGNYRKTLLGEVSPQQLTQAVAEASAKCRAG